jgi:hypothetical protein
MMSDAEHVDYFAIAPREAPALGLPIDALYRHLQHTEGDVERAIERYLRFRENSGAIPVVWQDHTFPTRRHFSRWLAGEFGVTLGAVNAQLYQRGWDIAAVIAYFRGRTRFEEPALPLPAPAAPVPGPETPHIGQDPDPEIKPELIRQIGNGEHQLAWRADLAGAAAADRTNGLTATIAGHLAGLAAAFAAQYDRPTTATAARDIAPLVRVLADQENQLARLTARIRHLERLQDDKRQGRAAQTDMLTVIMHKVGQLAHDFEQMRNRSPAPRFTRARPLGVEPKE